MVRPMTMIGFFSFLTVLACSGEPPGGDDGGGGDSAGETSIPDGVTLGDVVPCDSPVDAVSYAEVGQAWGLQAAPEPDGPHGEGGSTAVLDVDQDGDLDIVIAYPRTPLRLYRRDGDGFSLENVSEGPDPWLLSLADLDEDGRLDLLVGAVQPLAYRAEGDGFASPNALELPPGTSFASVSKALAPGDLDGDGHIDLYVVVNAGGLEPTGAELADYVMWGDGAGGLTTDTTAVPAAGQRRGFDASVIEWQGQTAVYVANDMGPDFGGNVLFTVDGRTLVDRSDDCECGIEHSAMGHDIGDWNGDGLADVYVAATPWNTLLTAYDDGSFVDVAHSVGAEGIARQAELGMSWGAAFVDFDNDGQVDILDAQGDLWFPDDPNLPYLPQPIWLLRQDQGAFTEVGEALGLAQEGSFRSVVADDHNGDGVVDLLVTDVVAAPKLYLSQGCTANAWLQVAAVPDSRVDLTAGGRTATAWTQTHSGYGGARRPLVQFGLGGADVVDRIVVTPPGREPVVIDGPLDARRLVVVGNPPGVSP